MAEVLSSESAELVSDLPADLESPDVPALGNTTAVQSNTVPKGKTTVTLSWAGEPFKGEPIGGELLDIATGDVQVVESDYDPILSGSYELWELSAAEAAPTTLTAAQSAQSKSLPVASTAGLVANDWVRIGSGPTLEFQRILGTSGANVLLGGNGLQFAQPLGAELAKVSSASLKVQTVDYVVTLATGQFTLVDNAFAVGSRVVLKYQSGDIDDLAGFEVYRVAGVGPLVATYSEVLALPGVQFLSALNAAANGFQHERPDTENGTTWTYYVFAKDDEVAANWSRVAAVLVEMIPSIPQNVVLTPGNNKVTVAWTAVSDPNVTGVNLYRSVGAVFDKSQAFKLNTTPVAGTSFVDGEENVTNRVSPGTTPFPVNGTQYAYGLESVDVVTGWTTGTQNQSQQPLKADVLTAVK